MAERLHLTATGHVTPEFASLLEKAALGRPAARLSEQDIKAAAILLGDIPLDQLVRAYGRALREQAGSFMPSPADIRRLVEGTPEDAALLAWSSLCRAVQEAGAYASLEVADGAAAGALLAVWGSWASFCDEPEGPGLALRRTEFLAHYRRLRREGPLGPRRLAGTIEAQGPPDGSRVLTATVSADGLVAVPRKALPPRGGA